MSAYFVAQINIHDMKAYDQYLAGFDEIFEGYAGEVLAVDDATLTLEGEWPFQRTVIIRFPSREELLRWYKSEEYQRLAGIRWKAAEANIAAVGGLE